MHIAGQVAFAQSVKSDSIRESTNVTQQIWLDFNPSFALSDRYTVYGDLDARTVFPNAWYRFVAGLALKYNKPKIFFKKASYHEEIHVGLRLFYTHNKYQDDRFEIRFFQGYALRWPFTRAIRWDNYLRLEERLDLDQSDKTYKFGLRVRWLTSIFYTFQGTHWKANKGTFIMFAAEVFATVINTNQFNDLLRVTGAIGRNFNDEWSAQFDLGFFLTRQTVENKFQTNDIIFRLRAYYKIPQKGQGRRADIQKDNSR